MCDSCGCALSHHHDHDDHEHADHPHGSSRIQADLYQNLLAANERQADENRKVLSDHGILGINLMSSPGSGKTSLIESIVRRVGARWRVGVIEGDLATDRDAQRIAALGIPAWQIKTGSTCHLDAKMVHGALHELALDSLDVLFVENVGNLVCPGLYDLGCHINGVLLSVPEGDDKVAKYPVVFRRAQFFGVTKTDLLAVLSFDAQKVQREATILKGDIRCFTCSCKTGEGVETLVSYFETERSRLASLR